jgi:NOL1/NOP2/fmu family ribosome biogenesis protein
MAYKLLRYEWKDNIEVDLNDVELWMYGQNLTVQNKPVAGSCEQHMNTYTAHKAGKKLTDHISDWKVKGKVVPVLN